MSALVIAAAIIFTHSSDGQTVDLHDQVAHCKSGTLLTIHTAEDKAQTKGCWRPQAGRVLIRWDDGDFGLMMPESFTKVGPAP